MRTQLLIIPFLLSGIILKAQTNLDSLFTVWQDESQKDSNRVVAYKDYIWNAFLFSQPDTAFILAEELLNYADDNNYPKAKSLGYNIQGISYHLQSDYAKALHYYTSSLTILEELGDQRGIASSLNNMGIIYEEQGNYPKTLNYYIQSLAILKQLDDQRGIAKSLNNIGMIHQIEGDYSKALDYYTNSLTIKKQLGNQRGIAYSLNSLGLLYQEQGDYSKSLDCYMQSLAILKQLGDQRGIANSLNGIGTIYQFQGDYSKALDYYMQGLAIFKQFGDQTGIAYSLNSLGLLYQEKGDYHKALKYCDKGYELALSVGILEQQKAGCNCLYDTYKALGKGSNALGYLEKMQVINDSLNAQETIKQLERMEFQKQVTADSLARAEKARRAEQKEKEILATKKYKNRIQYSLVALVVFLLAAILASMTKISFNPKVASGLIFVLFILIFEFLLVVLDPYVDVATDGEVGFKIGINSLIALVIFGVHQISERRLKQVLMKRVEENKNGMHQEAIK